MIERQLFRVDPNDYYEKARQTFFSLDESQKSLLHSVLATEKAFSSAEDLLLKLHELAFSSLRGIKLAGLFNGPEKSLVMTFGMAYHEDMPTITLRVDAHEEKRYSIQATQMEKDGNITRFEPLCNIPFEHLVLFLESFFLKGIPNTIPLIEEHYSLEDHGDFR